MYLDKLAKGEFTVPSLLANEKIYNVFMRSRESDL